MGNCLRHESSMQWGGDDWGSPVPERFFSSSGSSRPDNKVMNIEEEELLGDDERLLTSSTTSSTEVKIKITKKQLEELLGRVDMKELSVEQVLAQLMNVSSHQYESHQRSWTPNLQSYEFGPRIRPRVTRPFKRLRRGTAIRESRLKKKEKDSVLCDNGDDDIEEFSSQEDFFRDAHPSIQYNSVRSSIAWFWGSE
ncbi:hypothetical protein GH714_012266 [Hevea brasiliensis]|uniref:Uncharacterized protein n=1 Tax=Hevea brasiliensis TaxID=3981 RepID=A0A6A6KMU9_HEVBR|nr:hypothetical protein GH714_012266 [Hevea brasiliensis]